MILAACATWSEPFVVDAPDVETMAVAGIDVATARWTLAGTAAHEDGEIAVHYCCRAWGSARTTVELPVGTVSLEIDHVSDCARALWIAVRAPDGRALLHDRLLATQLVTVPAELAGTSLELELRAEGGLRCCGDSRITRIAIVRR